jgi:putative SOS response-associated peptidase YedK
MCGRYTLAKRREEIARIFQTAIDFPLVERFNVAPSQGVLTIKLLNDARQASLLQWGLIPSWSNDPSHGQINARAESVATKPAFRNAFKASRCLIVADGFYEWLKTGKARHPYFFRMKDEHPFAFAGLCEHWQRNDAVIDSCALITTEPNSVVEPIHNRMPAILLPANYDRWLDPATEKEELLGMLSPYPADEMTAHAVGRMVNSPANDTASCITPAKVDNGQQSLF